MASDYAGIDLLTITDKLGRDIVNPKTNKCFEVFTPNERVEDMRNKVPEGFLLIVGESKTTFIQTEDIVSITF